MSNLRVTVKVPEIEGALEVVSLCRGEKGHFYGGFTGAKGKLFFRYDIAADEFTDLGDRVVSAPEITTFSGKPLSQKIHHALVRLPDGRIAGGTGQNYSTHTLYTDRDDGGHVFFYDPRSGRSVDLGIPCPHEWIINLTSDPAGENLYGMSYPLNHVFRVHVKRGEMRVVGQPIAGSYGDCGCCHECCTDEEGNLYGSGTGGHIWKYDPRRDELAPTSMRLPEGALRVDSLIRGPGNLLYAGTWETGHVVRMDARKGRLDVLGQPAAGPRLPALAWRADGCLYGAAGGGDQYKGRNAFLFRFDPRTSRLEEIGTIESKEQGIVAERIHTMIAGDDGTLYAGETGGKSLLPGEAAMHPYLYVCKIS